MISFIVPTIGRASLDKTLASIEARSGDEVLIVGNVVASLIWKDGVRFHRIRCENAHNYGCLERTLAIEKARGKYLAFIDDDDVYARGHREAMVLAGYTTPDRPVIFKMQYPNGTILWQDRVVRCGNVSTQMLLVPNTPSKLGAWGAHYAGDFDFMNSWKWKPEEIVWRPEIIAQLGFNAGPHE